MTISKASACKSGSRNRSKLDGANSGDRSRRPRFPAALVLVCTGLILLAGCKGGSSSSITVQIEPATSVSVDEGQSFNFKATLANDVSNKGVTWSLTQSTTTGCSGSGCGTLHNVTPFSVTYTAPPVGTFSATTSVTLTAKSVAKTGTTATATISVVLPPTFTTTTLPNAANGVPYRQAITVTGGVAPLTFKLTSGSLPAGLTLNPSGTIVGIPSGSGRSNFTAAVTDSGSSPLAVAQAFVLTVNPAPALSIATTGLPPGFVNAKYSAPISAIGGALPLAWTISVGSLPPGLVLSPTSGNISGTPTTQGTYPFTVQAKDSSLPAPGQTAQGAFSITIAQPAPLSISTTSLPPGTTATAYNTSLIATGGIAPYTWAVSTGQLPPGLTLAQDGAISGIPILATTTPDQFTVQVTDSAVIASTSTGSLSITVAAGTTSNTLLNGQYAFLFKGFDSGGPVAMAGSFIADGNGHITVGAEDSNRTSGVVTGITLTGTYSIGSDGRGTLELIATNPSTNVKLTSDYQLALDSNGNARFIQNDTTSTNTDTVGTHGQGTLKFVAGTATSTSTTTFSSSFTAGSLSGNYAFGLSGQGSSGKPAALIGEIHSDGIKTLSPSGGGLFNSDFNDTGAYSSQSLSGGFSVGANFNRGLAQLVFAPPSKPSIALNFAFYFVSPSDLYFVEVDTKSSPGVVFDRLSGEMSLQQPGYQFQDASLAGQIVATGTGLGGSNASVLAGLLTSLTGDGNATLTYDENDAGTIPTPSPAFSGTYTVAGNGRVNFSGLRAARVAAAYLTGPGRGFLMGSDAAVTVGRLEPQTGGPSFSLSSFEGNYVLDAAPPAENLVANFVGQVDASGAGSVVGTVDEIDPPTSANLKGKANLDQSLVANVNMASNGRGTMTLNLLRGLPVQLVLYIVSPGHVRAIPLDSNPGGHPEVIFLDH
jgi:hypothetical protein